MVQALILKPGFPAADENVRDWFLESKTKLEAFTRAGAFLCALFVAVLDCLRHIDDKIASIEPHPHEDQPDSIAAKFRLLMTVGQTFSQQGQRRREFYDGVLRIANNVCFLDIIVIEAIHQTTLYQLWSPPQPSTPPRKPMPASPGLSFNTVRGADGWEVRYDLKEELGKLMNYLIEGFNVLALEIPHKGGRTFGYRITEGASSITYMSDHCPIALGAGPDGLGVYHPAALSLARECDLLFHGARERA